MKIRTKFLAAVLAATMTLGCALTASAFTAYPTLTLQGNESSPLTLKNQAASATLTLKASDFSEVKGAKITVELPAALKLSKIAVTDTESNWELGEGNYKVDGKKITMVDVFNFNDSDTVNKENLNLNLSFDVTGASIGTYEVKVSGDFADEAADKVYPVTANANLVIGREETTATNLKGLNDSIADAKNYFIPYGGAYIRNNNLPKGQDGKFSLGGATDGTIGLLKCKLPVGKAVTTFGVSKGLENFTNDGATAIQFGSYVNEVVSGYTYGTLFIAPGNATFEDAVKYYKENTRYTTEAAILERFIQILTTNKAKAKELHTIKFNNKTQSIKVAYVPQSNYMWKDAAKGQPCSKLQYAVRYKLTDENKNTVYTAVGYSYDTAKSKYNFSTEIKSSSYNAMP